MYVQVSTVHLVEQILLSTYGQFRTSSEMSMSYLGCTWDFSEKYFVKVSQTGMIQDLVASRERTHVDRGTCARPSAVVPGDCRYSHQAWVYCQPERCMHLQQEGKRHSNHHRCIR